VPSALSDRFAAVDFAGTTIGFAVGKAGLILRTLDGGLHWVKLKSRTAQRLSAVCFVDSSNGWVLGSRGVRRRTTTGGKTWIGHH